MKVILIKTPLAILILCIATATYMDGQVDPATNNSIISGRASATAEEDYRFRIGETVRASFVDNCSVLIGVVSSLDDKKVTVSISERLWGEYRDQTIELVRDLRQVAYSEPSEWERVSLGLGKRLLVSQCAVGDGQRRPKLTVSNEVHFQSVRDVVLFENRLRQSPNVISDLPQILVRSNDGIFGGYATQLLRGTTAENANEVALVIADILENNSLPPIGMALVRIKLRQLLVREGDRRLNMETRRNVIARLVRTASQPTRPSDQVFILLLELAKSKKVDVSSFLNESNRAGLSTNYRTFIRSNPSQDGTMEFERQLNRTH